MQPKNVACENGLDFVDKSGWQLIQYDDIKKSPTVEIGVFFLLKSMTTIKNEMVFSIQICNNAV